jgi:2-polyprenyl-6-methoxyphenol hydroxylase-like FAD-dependent oxidoreductase
MVVDIIGAGIGGLTAAIALEKKGFHPKIYEQAETLKTVGAGIILASNAMQVYKRLGMDEELKSHGISLNTMNITNDKLQVLSKVDLTYFKDKYNIQSIAIHRGKLQQVLLNNLKRTEVALDHKLKNIIKHNNGYQLDFENGKSINSTLLIGADGMHSKVRTTLFPKSEIRSMNQVCWRGVTKFELPSIYKNQLNEAWGKGDRFAFVQFSPDQIYWYAVKSYKESKDEFSGNDLSLYFHKYPSIVQEIIKATPANWLHTSIMQDLKPIKNWYNDMSCLIGDAAHATTPNMGQGACQSIEDAYVLADCLSKQNDSTAFKKYQNLRMAKAHQVVNQSWQIGKISHWTSPLGVAFRNTMLKLVPDTLTQMQLEKLFQLEKQLI